MNQFRDFMGTIIELEDAYHKGESVLKHGDSGFPIIHGSVEAVRWEGEILSTNDKSFEEYALAFIAMKASRYIK